MSRQISNDLNDRRIELESAIIEAEGNVLLLGLAIADILRDSKNEGGFHVLHLTAHQVRALNHADTMIFCNVRDLSKAFYDRETEDML